MTKLQSALQFARAELKAERFPSIGYYVSDGEYHMTCAGGALTSDPALPSLDALAAVRSRILARASKLHWKA